MGRPQGQSLKIGVQSCQVLLDARRRSGFDLAIHDRKIRRRIGHETHLAQGNAQMRDFIDRIRVCHSGKCQRQQDTTPQNRSSSR